MRERGEPPSGVEGSRSSGSARRPLQSLQRDAATGAAGTRPRPSRAEPDRHVTSFKGSDEAIVGKVLRIDPVGELNDDAAGQRVGSSGSDCSG